MKGKHWKQNIRDGIFKFQVRMALHWSLKLTGSQPSCRALRKSTNVSFTHSKYGDKGTERNETVKRQSSDHNVLKNANVTYSKWDLQVEKRYHLRSSDQMW